MGGLGGLSGLGGLCGLCLVGWVCGLVGWCILVQISLMECQHNFHSRHLLVILSGNMRSKNRVKFSILAKWPIKLVLISLVSVHGMKQLRVFLLLPGWLVI